MKHGLLVMLAFTATVWGQTWSGSGSNGSDGALDLGANSPGVTAGELIFDPVTLNLDQNGDNIFHFTTITIRDNIRVRFLANRMRRPGAVVFLASGAVNIAGKLDFSGEVGHPGGTNDSLRRISIPGPGGFAGGIGAKGTLIARAGFGPGGGKVGPPDSSFGFPARIGNGCPGAYTGAIVPSFCATVVPPATYGTNLLQPLIGGSGGGGQNAPNGAGGGAGGGAFRLSSSVHIVFGTGVSNQSAAGCSDQFQVIADGGPGGFDASGWGGPGAGGGIHLQAPLVSGCSVNVYARGGQGDGHVASEGRIRIDATFNTVSTNPLATTGPLVDAPAPPNQPFLRITSINGVTVPASPRFSYTTPDVLINSTSPVPIVFEANNIPVNTPVTLLITTDTGADITATVNLTGTVATSTATTSVTLPLGTARLLARAIW